MDFHPSPADPCLYIKKAKGNEPPAYIILYVDDGVIFGTPQIIETVMKSISLVLKVKDLGEVKNFVGCRLVHSTDGKTIHIFQPKLIKNLEDSFSQYINTNRKFQTPGAPKTVVMLPEKVYFLPKTKLSIVLVLVCYCIWLSIQDLTSQML